MKVVLYHKNCKDGLFSAYSCWLAFKDEAIYIPVDYKPIQDITPQEALDYIFKDHSNITPEVYSDIELYVVDYSFPVEHFRYHTTVFKYTTVLDHHKTAYDAYSEQFIMTSNESNKFSFVLDKATVVFSTDMSGAKLTYTYLFPYENVPFFIEMVSDRDLWTFKHAETKHFGYGLDFINENDFAKLHTLVYNEMDKILELGVMYENYLTNRIKKIKNSGLIPITVYIDGIPNTGAIVNSFLDISSELCSSIYSEGYSIAIAYYIKEKNVTMSIRSKKNVDSSPIAVYYGGGGHKSASGCTISMDELNRILNTKEIRVNTNLEYSLGV